MKSDAFDTPEQNMTAERLKSLYELIGLMNSVYELQELLEFVVDRALSLTGGRRGLLLLSDDDEHKLQRVAVVRGKEMDAARREQALKFVSTTVIKDVLARGEPRLVMDLPVDQRYEKTVSEMSILHARSVLAVPLKTEAQLVGLIYIDHPSRKIFGAADLDFLSAFASQAALVINRARQHQHQVERLTLLNELSRSVVQVLDLDEVLTRIVHEATRMLNVETGSVLLLDEAASELVFATSISNGRRVNITTRLWRDQGIAGQVMSTGEPACISDVSRDPRWFGKEVETGFTTHSLLCVPLQLNGRVLGVLQALNKKSAQGFNSADIALLSAFAASATIAIENARLFKEARQACRLRILNEMALALSSTLDLPAVLNIGLKKSLEVLEADAGAISLIDEQSQIDSLSIRVSWGLSQEPDLAKQQTWVLNNLSPLVLGHQADEILVIDETYPNQKSKTAALLNSGIEALALAPIKAGNKISGALAVMSTTPHTYNAEETSLLSSIARIIGLAVQNATYYNREQAQTMHLTYLTEVGSALTSSLELAHVLKVIIEGANDLLETERTSVFLINNETNELVLRYSNEGDVDIRLPPPWQGIAGWVAGHDQPALVNDVPNDERYLPEISHKTGFKIRSILCVPLKIEEQVIGVVEVLNKTNDRQFNLQDQAMLVDFTKWAAIAIHNARLFQRLTSEQQRRINAEVLSAMVDLSGRMVHRMRGHLGGARSDIEEIWSEYLNDIRQTFGASSLPDRIADNLDLTEELLADIYKAMGNALTMVDNLRKPFKIELGPVSVKAGINKALGEFSCPSNVTLDISKAIAGLPRVKGSLEHLSEVFHILFVNAIDAMHDGGQITVACKPPHNQKVEITVVDMGLGMNREVMSKIFHYGFTTKAKEKESAGGYGFGLWWVKTYLQRIQGDIHIQSDPGQGSQFSLVLPVWSDATPGR